MIVQTAWQNALYINPIEYSIFYCYKSYWIIYTIYTKKYFYNISWNSEHMAIINAIEF